MVEFKVPLGMKYLFKRIASYFPNFTAPPVSWRQLTVMCWIRWRKRNSPLLPEILDGLYWKALPQYMKKRVLSTTSRKST